MKLEGPSIQYSKVEEAYKRIIMEWKCFGHF